MPSPEKSVTEKKNLKVNGTGHQPAFIAERRKKMIRHDTSERGQHLLEEILVVSCMIFSSIDKKPSRTGVDL